MRNCIFPQNVIKLLDLKFENGIEPYDFVPTLAYLVYENPSRDGVMFLQYYTTEATYAEIAAAYGIGAETVRQAVMRVARRLNNPVRIRKMMKGIRKVAEDSCKEDVEKLREKNKDKIENTERLVKEARNKALKEGAKQGYDKGYDDGYKACRRQRSVGRHPCPPVGVECATSCRRHYWEEIESAPADAAENETPQSSQFSLKDKFSPDDMSTRLFNILLRGGLRTLGDILTKTPEELLKLRNMGKKTYEELVGYLVKHCGERREDWMRDCLDACRL